MAKTIQLRAHHTVPELKAAVRTSTDPGQKNRLRAIIKLKQGATRTSVAEDFVVRNNTITDWVSRYNEGGIAALKMSKGGRPEGNPTWDTDIFKALVSEINTNDQYWSAPLMQEWIQKQHGKEVPESTIYYHLKIHNLSYKSARPSPYKGNKEAQEAFKKGA
jgi:transposase